MKLRLAIIFCILSSVVSAQRGKVPQKNPDNSLDLKVVFQEYTVTTTYAHGGYTTSKGEYLNLKVNNLYLEDGYTGIDKKTFQQYLSNCPKALDIGLQGLDKYKESNKFYRIGKWFQWGGFATGGYLALRDGDDIDEGTLTKLFVPFLTGMAGKFILSRKGRKLEKRADDLVVDAFGYYSDNCYRPDLDNSSAYEPSENESIDNGESSNKEEVLLDIISNNPKSKFLTIGGTLGMSSFSSPNLKLGPDVSYYKEGFYLNAHAYISRYATLGEPSSIDPQYGGYLLASIPFRKKVKQPKKSYLSLGTMQGLETVAESESADLKYFAAFSLDMGVDHSQQYVNKFGSFEEYFQKSSMVRAGLSRTIFAETAFNVNDNRFSNKTRYQVGFVRLYLNALYDLGTEFNDDFITTNPIFNLNMIPEVNSDLGFAFGVELKGTQKRKKGAFIFNLEGGRYPFGWGGRIGVGFSIYSVDRKKMKSKRRRGSDSVSRTSKKKNKRPVKKVGEKQINLQSDFAPKYAAGGPRALMDKKRGGKDFRKSGWQGYEGQDVTAVVDLGKKQKISELRMGFYHDEDAAIFMPTQLDVYIGDSENWQLFGSLTNNKITPSVTGTIIKDFVVKGEAQTQFVKVVAKSLGECPEYHKDAGSKSWIFSDEIVIK